MLRPLLMRITQANGGDFATGAVAAGVSEAVSKELATLVNNNPALQNMTAQLIGIATTALTGGDVNQAANVASMGDLYNNQLHPSDVKVAKALYNAQGAKKRFTLAQFEDALRSANNSKTGETASSNTFYNPNAPAELANQSHTDMLTGQTYDEMNPGTTNGAWVANSGTLTQSIPAPSAEIIAFIQQNPVAGSSIYSWDSALITPVITNSNSIVDNGNFSNTRESCFGECGAVYNPQSGKYMWIPAGIMGQSATAAQFGGTIGMYEPHSTLDDTKILAGTAAAATLAILAPQVVVASPTAAAVGAGTSGAVNATTQYVKYGEILYPAELISSTVLGGVAGPLMANSNIYYNIGYGGSFATANSAFLNSYYTPQERTPDILSESFFFGGLGGGTGKWFDSTLTRSWISGIPQYIRPQGYSPELGALLNPSPIINPVLGWSILIKDIGSSLTGAGAETVTKETWEKVNAK